MPYWMSTGVCVYACCVGGSGCRTGCLQVCACMRAEWEVQGSVLDVYRCVRVCMYACCVGGSGFCTGCLQVCACVQVCVLCGRFRVPYWMSTGVCVRACMRAVLEVQGAVLDVYRCVRVCEYACWVGGSGLSTGCLQVCLSVCVRVCVLSGSFRVLYWMSTGVCVCASMCAEWEVQGSVLDVYRCVRVCMYVC